jgi:hypothetical protein
LDDDEDDSEESAERTPGQRKRTKNNNNGGGVNSRNNYKRRRNKYDQIDHYDEDWRVEPDMEEFVPITYDHRRTGDVASGSTAASADTHASAGRLTTAATVGSGSDKRTGATVTMPPPPRLSVEPAWTISGGRAAAPSRRSCTASCLVLLLWRVLPV